MYIPKKIDVYEQVDRSLFIFSISYTWNEKNFTEIILKR